MCFVLSGALLLAACGSGDGSSGSAPPEATDAPTTEPAVTEPEATDAPTTEPAVTEPEATDAPTTEPAVTEPEATDAPTAWSTFDHDGDCVCADGSPIEFLERPADPTKVVLYFEGGGACFSAETCALEGGTYVSSDEVTAEGLAARGGIFDAANPENPLADHTFVYVPYCTGDVHLGATTTEYSDELTIRHNGFVNGVAALDHLVATYPGAEQLIVTGASAGSVPTPLFAGLAADLLPDAEIITFGDSSGAYPDVPAINAVIGGVWGTAGSIPDWPENEGLTVEDWSFPDLYVQAGRHAPDITFARFDHAFDEVQATFGALAGVAADDLVTLIDETEAQVEAGGVPLATFVAPGTDHTIIGGDGFYEMEVGGVRLVDWLAALVDGEVPADVHCDVCN